MENKEKWTEGTRRVEIIIRSKRTRDNLIIMKNKRRLHYSLATKQFNAFVFLEFMWSLIRPLFEYI